MANINHHHHLQLPNPLPVELKFNSLPDFKKSQQKSPKVFWLELIKILIPVLVAIFGYWKVDSLAREREREGRLYNAKVTTSLDAYDHLMQAYKLNREDPNDGLDELEKRLQECTYWESLNRSRKLTKF